MPNWVFNSLSISGEPEKVIKVKEQLNQPFSREYDEWVFETKSYIKKETNHSNPVFAFWNIVRPPEDKFDEYFARKGYDKNGSYGDTEFNWYNFNIREWGTKWDVAVLDDEEYPDTEIMIDEPDNVQYRFNTAWSPPVPVIDVLSKQHPDCVFDLEYEEEQGWGGEIVFKNGEIVSQAEYENRCHECDDYDTMEWDEEKEISICKKCGYEW
jgi:hypothetical protein